MTYRVVILRCADEDSSAIYVWLAKRSSAGAGRWYRTFLAAAASLKNNPLRHSLAPSPDKSVMRCGSTFLTPRGRKFHLLFLLVGDEVRILRIRGPGQASVTRSDLDNETE